MTIFLLLLTLGFLIAAGFHAVTITHDKNDERGIHIVLMHAVPWLCLAALAFIISLCFVTVDAGSEGVIKKFGNPVGQVGPGAHLILPWESVTPAAVQTRVVKLSTQSSSLDLQIVNTEVTLQYHVEPQNATYILVELNDDAEDRVIDPSLLESIKAVTARYDAQQLIAKRTEVRDGIESLVKEKLAAYRIVAENVSITNFNFSKEYNDIVEQKQVAQQNAEKAVNDLARITTEAKQKVAAAQGEADALKSQKEQITPELLELRTIEMMNAKWDGHLPESWVSSGNGSSPLPMFDVLKGSKK